MGGWANSTRRARLPKDWNRKVARIKQRDHGICQWPVGAGICGAPGRDVDHRNDPNDHRLEALWLLCAEHHNAKTAREAAAARAARPQRTRQPEAHPGLR